MTSLGAKEIKEAIKGKPLLSLRCADLVVAGRWCSHCSWRFTATAVCPSSRRSLESGEGVGRNVLGSAGAKEIAVILHECTSLQSLKYVVTNFFGRVI